MYSHMATPPRSETTKMSSVASRPTVADGSGSRSVTPIHQNAVSDTYLQLEMGA
jgi:hypothetical protein